jgi:hypothetical protein
MSGVEEIKNWWPYKRINHKNIKQTTAKHKKANNKEVDIDEL